VITLPSLALNLLPWQGQSMVPSATWSTMHWACVQTALNALYSPADGWVTTTLAEVKILPPPTGTSLVAPSVVVIPPPAAGDEPELATPDAPEPEPPLTESPEPLLPPQAVTASPARPIPASPPLTSTARRGQTGWNSCVTVFLRDQ